MNKINFEVCDLKNKIVKLEIENKVLKAQINTLKSIIYSEKIKANTEEAFKQS